MVNGVQKLNLFQRHINKCVTNEKYAAKTLLGSAIGLTLASNFADAVQLDKNKKIKPDERRYLSTYQYTTGIVSAVAQGAVGATLISDATQNFIKKQVSKVPQLAKTLAEVPGAQKNLMKLTSLVAVLMLAKRLLVPFVSTPIASMVNNVREKLAKEDKPVENIFESKGYKFNDDNFKKHDDD